MQSNQFEAGRPDGDVTTIGVVLAGGKSSRMGQNKALLSVAAAANSDRNAVADGSTLLSFMTSLLQQAGCDDVLISGADVGGVPDRIADAGPLAGIDGILSGLADPPGAHSPIVLRQLLIVPVDMPALTPTLLRTLLTAGAGSVAAHFTDRMLPVVLPVTSTTREAVASLLSAQASRSLRALLARLDAQALPVPGNFDGQFLNLNTPMEWQQWRATRGAER